MNERLYPNHRNLGRDTDTSDEGGDEGGSGLGAGNSLSKAKEESEVAVDPIVALELAGSLDALPCRCNLNQHTLLLNPNGFIESNELLGLGLGGLLVERQAGVDLS